MTAQVESYECSVPGCRKVFKRPEHLSRHEKVHDPANVSVCPVCGKEFNRKDSLARHLTLHSIQPGVEIPKKGKKACEGCRKGKIRCDGAQKCKTCIRKGLDCVYVEEEGQDDVEMRDRAVLPPRELDKPNLIVESINPSTLSTQLTDPEPVLNLDVDQNSMPSVDFIQSSPAVPELPVPAPRKVFDWKTIVVQKDLTNSPESTLELTDEGKDAYLDSYFLRFHHHWPIVHRVGSNAAVDYPMLLATVRMVGAWLEKSEGGLSFALATYKQLMDCFVARLRTITSVDRIQHSVSTDLCQSILITVIFDVYRGGKQEISQARYLVNALVTALRQTEFFSEDTAYRDQRLDIFPPMKLVTLGSRQRLAAYIFKIETYLDMLQDQPQILSTEELHFTLPTTFALYNTFGLDVLAGRLPTEPVHRSQTTIFEMIRDLLSGINHSMRPTLVEDLQLCLCAMWQSIWKLSKTRAINKSSTGVADPDTVRLQMQLVGLGYRLEEVSRPFFSSPTAPTDGLLVRNYFGIEDSSHADSPKLALRRIWGLALSALLFRHALSLHIAAHIPTFSRLAKDQHLTPVEESSEEHRRARERRKIIVKEWSQTSDARRTLCLITDILVAHESLAACVEKSVSVDPMAHIALIFAALAVWAYCTHGAGGCNFCIPTQLGPGVELTNWSKLGFETSKDEREAWIEIGDGYCPTIHGLQLCSCNVKFLVGEFKKYVPMRWQVGEVIFGELWTELK